MQCLSKTYYLKLVLLVLILYSVFTLGRLEAQDSTEITISSLSWSTERIEKGVYWKSYKGSDLFDSKQNINLIEVFLDSLSAEFKVAFLRDSMTETSKFAFENRAMVAVNGSFFRRDTGGPSVFLKVNGEVVFEGHPKQNRYHESGALAWSSDKPIQILRKPDNGWIKAPFDTILSSGPLLIFDSVIQDFNNDPFHQNRHPRTAAAITNDERLYLVTIDGRSFQAYGMTIPELTMFLNKMGAVSALNLDGGGSTSMWIKNSTDSGIVNYPSDNLEFDHEGERRVSNALLIVPSD